MSDGWEDGAVVRMSPGDDITFPCGCRYDWSQTQPCPMMRITPCDGHASPPQIYLKEFKPQRLAEAGKLPK